MSQFPRKPRCGNGPLPMLLIGLALGGCTGGQTPNGETADFDTLGWDLGAASCERDVRCGVIASDDLDDCTANRNSQFSGELQNGESAGLVRDESCDAIYVDATRNASCEATPEELSCALVPCRAIHGDKPLGDACGPDVDDCAQALLCDPTERVCVDPCEVLAESPEE